MLKQTPLYDTHVALGALMVDFGGWNMPLHYGSQLDEHHAVRQAAGMFDVSHMTVIDLSGSQAQAFLQRLLTQDVATIQKVGEAKYSLMLNEQGGVIDDLLVYKLKDGYRLIVNAATRDKDLAWMQKINADFTCAIHERDDLAILAVQGPKAREAVHEHYSQHSQALGALASFTALELNEHMMIARTGYTGEDGYEIVLKNAELVSTFNALKELGVMPCGLGARDTLRLEAGMCLYGQDLDESQSPYSANLAWAIDLADSQRMFIGRKVLESDVSAKRYRMLGLVLKKGGVMRHDMSVVAFDGEQCTPLGTITSGGFSPSLKQSIAFARVDRQLFKQYKDATIAVDIRGKPKQVEVGKPIFYKRGEAVFKAFGSE